MNPPTAHPPRWLRRGFDSFAEIIRAERTPVVLLEGSRNAPADVQARMEILASQLMREFPSLLARSGNAEGSDQAWARGVNTVDPRRLQLILPAPRYKAAAIHEANESLALRDARNPAAPRHVS